MMKQIVNELNSVIKSLQEEEMTDVGFLSDGLSGLTKRAAINKIYKITSKLTKGIFKDSDWHNVNKIFAVLEEVGIHCVSTNVYYGKQQFSNEFPPTQKTWEFQIHFLNDKNKGKPTILYGYLKAMGAGSVQEPLDKYDMVFIVG